MTGQLTTSFQQGMENPTMTSTTCNPCAEHVTGVSKTGCCNESPGAIHALARGRVMTGGGSYWSSHRPRLLKLRRAKHRASWVRYGYRAQLLWIRLTWRTHWHPSLLNKIQKIKKFGK